MRKESLKNIEDAFFLNEAIRVGMEINKRDTLLKILDRDFELNNVQKDAISKQIKNFSIDGLSKHLLYHTTRQEFIDGLFPKQTERPKEHDMLVQFEALFCEK